MGAESKQSLNLLREAGTVAGGISVGMGNGFSSKNKQTTKKNPVLFANAWRHVSQPANSAVRFWFRWERMRYAGGRTSRGKEGSIGGRELAYSENKSLVLLSES